MLNIFKKKRLSDDTATKIKQAFDDFRANTSAPSVRMRAYREKTQLMESKFGGNPYFPAHMDFPKDEDGQPLKLLAQLNFDELPNLPNFPKTGLLQFFIRQDDVYGCDFYDETTPKNFRVIYHENMEISPVAEIPMATVEEGFFPLEGEFSLKIEEEMMPMSTSDYRFNATILTILKKYFPKIKANTYFDFYENFEEKEILEEQYNQLFQDTVGHRLGGYADFTQIDPRSYDSKGLACYDTLLFQMDSENPINYGNYNDAIRWGDMGIGNFFISKKDLQELNFSKVAYNWDCG